MSIVAPHQARTLTLVVPVRDEAHRFAEHAPALCDFISRYPVGSELVFVDDGSHDRTASLVERTRRRTPARRAPPARPHRGKGAVMAGLAE